MEMRDPDSALNPAEEQTPIAAPASESVAATEQPETAATEVTEDDAMADDESTAEAPLSREALLDFAKEVLAKDASDISADDIRHLRQQINAFRKAEPSSEAEQAPEAEDDELKAIFDQIRDKKAEYTARVEAERLANLERKKAIVAEILALAEDTDNVNRTFPRYRELQDEFNAIGEVPPTEDTAIWKQFTDARERYSDNLKINKELRDYDFRKNLDSKSLLLDEAQSLLTEEDVIVAYRRLQELHTKWRQIGPVAKEFREEIWEKFKAASAEINKRYQAHFEARKARELENEAGKTALCERLEALDLDSLRSFVAWDEATKQVIGLQEEWRKFGFASKKQNKALFARFRALCDRFFAAKAEYFHSTRAELANNLARKTALAERAEALKDSTDWKEATEQFVAMQKEWKTIGTVAKKYSDAVWRRFQAACDYFFEQKKKAHSGARRQETENLQAKRQVITDLETITTETPREEAIEALRAAQARWQEIGHVPFREKDKVYEAYRAKVDELRQLLDLRGKQARMERFSESIQTLEGDENKLYRERERLTRALEARRQELRTYENNLGFLTSSSRSGDSMLREFERKADRLRADIADLEEKIKLIDSKF